MAIAHEDVGAVHFAVSEHYAVVSPELGLHHTAHGLVHGVGR